MNSVFTDWVKKFRILSTGILHVGGHLAEESDEYHALGFDRVIWVEALEDVAAEASKKIHHYPNQEVVCATLSSQAGQQLKFFRAGNNGSSSSVLKPHLIKAAHPEVDVSQEIIVTTQTLDNLFGNLEGFEFLCLDVQGGELEVLRGGLNSLKKFKYVMTEVSIRKLYKNGPLFKDITKFLNENNFELIASNINATTGWGDALFIRRDIFQELDNSLKLGFHKKSKQGLGIFTKIRGIFIHLGINAKWLNPALYFKRRNFKLKFKKFWYKRWK